MSRYQWRTQDFADVYAHFVLCVYLGVEVGMAVGWNFHPTQQRRRAREVYALRFVRTSSYATGYTAQKKTLSTS